MAVEKARDLSSLVKPIVAGVVILAAFLLFRQPIIEALGGVSDVEFKGVKIRFVDGRQKPPLSDAAKRVMQDLTPASKVQLIGLSQTVNCFGPPLSAPLTRQNHEGLIRAGALEDVAEKDVSRVCAGRGVNNAEVALRVTPQGEEVRNFLIRLLDAMSDAGVRGPAT